MTPDSTDLSTRSEYPHPASKQDPWNMKDFAGNSSTPALSSVRKRRWVGTIGLNRCIFIVVVFAIFTNGLSLASSQLWVYPDSIDYIQLAGGIADRWDFHNELYLIRTPGYPMFLAAVFKIFGSSSPMAILVIQHAMVIITVVFAALIAWQLTNRLSVTLITGLLCAGSLQLLSYANLLLTETPFTLAVTGCVYCLIRYHREGANRFLIYASLTIGVGYLLKPIALFLIGVCFLTVLLRKIRETRITANNQWFKRLSQQLILGWTASSLPALLLVAPWMINNALTHHSLQATRCLDYMYYLRAATFDRLDSTRSESMLEIHRVVEEAIRKGDLRENADFRDRRTVMDAYQSVYHTTDFSESSAILGRAGRDLMFEYPGTIFINTFKYAAWIILGPDPVYRFQPGGVPGVNGRRVQDAAIFDIGTYAFGEDSWEWVLKDFRHYLPLKTETKPYTPLWTNITRWFYERIENGGSVFGVLDSPFEVVMVLCLLGGVCTLYTSQRESWFVLLTVVTLHILISSFLSGPERRYAVVIKPILMIFFAFMIVTLADLVLSVVSKYKKPIEKKTLSLGYSTKRNNQKEPVV